MSIFFSRQCEYALQAVLYLALKPRDEMTSIRELTTKLKMPYHFLAKILQNLTHKGFLNSYKGPKGGFSLKKSANDITIYNIIGAIDGDSFKHNCILGFPDCGGDIPCSVHEQWEKIREDINKMLISKNITEMASEMKKPQYKVTSR